MSSLCYDASCRNRHILLQHYCIPFLCNDIQKAYQNTDQCIVIGNVISLSEYGCIYLYLYLYLSVSVSMHSNRWCNICIISCPHILWWLYRVLSVSSHPCLNVPLYMEKKMHRWQLRNSSYFTDYQCVESRIPQDLFRRRALLADISIYIMQMNVF